MDVFELRNEVIQQYADYTKSFLNISDLEIREHVHTSLEDGVLWPDALVQLSPAYEQSQTVQDLVDAQVLDPKCADMFRAPDRQQQLRSIQLYQHQKQAIELAQQGKPFVVTSGTGSGKSLTYLIPIVDFILRHRSTTPQVRAIIVYPMNALINSQVAALERYHANLGDADRDLVSFARYTGQESDSERRTLQEQPPHILLTNYVMLELMLTRPDEAVFVDRNTALQFVVLDELHTYRGRQGADVALLMRRLRERSGNQDLLYIGTSATMASGGSQSDRLSAVARVATTVFGVEVPPSSVIEESLKRSVPVFGTPTEAELAQAVKAPVPDAMTWDQFKEHPLAAWIDGTFGVDVREDVVRRARPRSLRKGAEALAQRTGLDPDLCETRLRAFLRLGSQVRDSEGKPAFAFKLHQFISQGGAAYATLEPSGTRALTLEGQRYVAGPRGDRLLFPLVFCRECGQHYYMSAYDRQGRTVQPRLPMSRGEDVDEPAVAGYLVLGDDMWDGDDESLPDEWFTITEQGRKWNKEFLDYKPQKLYVRPDGSIVDANDAEGVTAWFLPAPFLTCLNCGVVYTRRNKDDFRKLARLSSEGRSTATTLTSMSSVEAMRASDLDPSAQKLLSFTDNRQDASLQAGHFNDFIDVVQLRSAIYRALTEAASDGTLDYLTAPAAVFAALNLPQEVYAKDVATLSGARRRNEEALKALIEYRLYEDLRRSWRVTQPDLEQCGLLNVDYLDLHELCQEASYWEGEAGHPVLTAAGPEGREFALRAMLNYMRSELAVDVPCLDPEKQEALRKKVNAHLNEAWRFGDDEQLRVATQFCLRSDTALPRATGRSLSVQANLGHFLRSNKAWPGLKAKLSGGEYERLLKAILKNLVGANILACRDDDKQLTYQIRHDALLWQPGDGKVPDPDPVRSRRTRSKPAPERKPNTFYSELYTRPAERLQALHADEHTGQIPQKTREEREQKFRSGELPVLYCSPTMELGIDIADLNVVHMRNVPPTPANYAQRGGRAGRQGQPAFIMTYCSTGSGHDQYFFQRQQDMVAGVVSPPQIELANEDLLRAHIHAVWIAFTSLPQARSMLDLVDVEQLNAPLREDIQKALLLSAEQRGTCLSACRRIVAQLGVASDRMPWFNDAWLSGVVEQAATDFDHACDRWRELYRAAEVQKNEARDQGDRAQRRRDVKERDLAERIENEAKRQIALLCGTRSDETGRTSQTDSEFYPYRYLASEGFLPGYNFPRLPVRAFLSVSKKAGEFLTRPRFLALTEFGPRNVIYHNGAKYQVERSQLPAGGAKDYLERAKLCRVCGYFHRGADLHHDHCQNCGTRLDGRTAEDLGALFEMTTAVTRRVERITCEEEERAREGFRLTTHYRFAPESSGLRRVRAETEGDGVLPLGLTYGQAATVWRINRGWRRSLHEGFALDVRSGKWYAPQDEAANSDADAGDRDMRHGVRIVVHDTRNLLIVEPPRDVCNDEQRLVSLQYALQQGIEAEFQLEEQELDSECLGEDGQGPLLFWEASEGGAGVLRRLVEEPEALAHVARRALEICHFDPHTGEERTDEKGECVRACYRCLLSYSNQPDHADLNRQAVRDDLLSLTRATVVREVPPPVATPPPNGSTSALAQRVLDYVQAHAGRLPQPFPVPDGVRPDLFYAPSFCVVCVEDGAPDDGRADALDAAGYNVIVIRGDAEVGPQLERYDFWQGYRGEVP